jgi:AAA15 family ATPase/GTPase
LLSQSDTGIGDTKVVDHELTPEMVEKTAKRAGIPPEEVPTVLHEVVFEHSFPNRPIDVSMFDESDGTVRIFCASGKIATVLEEGGILVADELDASLHTNLFEELVRLFMTPETNPKGAQLLFSAQNPHLLEARVLRRDQVWFADKDHRGATHVYPLSDFSPRQGESVANGYIVGRYSAVPVIPDLFGLADLGEGDAHGA